MSITRRTLLQRSLLAPLAIAPVALIQGCGRDSVALCADPDTLTRGEAQLRKTLEYISVSTDISQTCADCQFFRADNRASKGGCGECEILSGVVEATAYCTSWTLKS